MNMRKLAFTFSLAVFILAGCAMGGHGMSARHGGMDMKSRQGMAVKMDTNGDGMLSREEFMKGHEAMFDRMKGPNGMISLKDMPAH